MAWHRLEHARSRVSELDRQGSTKLEKSYIVETWTGSRVSMCPGSSRPPRGKPCFSSNSRASNSSSNNSRINSSRGLVVVVVVDLLSSSSRHKHPHNHDPSHTQSSYITFCTLILQTCEMSFKRRNNSGGEGGGGQVGEIHLLAFRMLEFNYLWI